MQTEKIQQTTIRGYSDDMIVVQGPFSEEFGCYESKDVVTRYVGCSDGTLLRVTYGENKKGLWRITLIRRGSCEFSKQEAEEGGKEYSDVVTLTGQISWVVCGKDYRVRA